jgi:hypothetical protein
MTFDADVIMTAKKWGLEPALLQAVVTAEGDILKAVRCAVPTAKDRQQALEITCRSATHALRDFIKEYGFGPTFISYWGNRWAPTGAANDPHGLNKNWVPNVTKLWLGDPPVKAVGEVPDEAA